MRDHPVVLDLQKLRMYFVGPGDYDLDKALSPGAVSFALEVAPSGHLLLPCNNFETLSTHVSQVHHAEVTPQAAGQAMTEAAGKVQSPVLTSSEEI